MRDLTSGSNEPVADQGKDGHSVFAYHLIKFLKENDKPYMIAGRIADHVIPLVARNAEQMPRSQPLQGANDEGGQFVLQLASVARGLEDTAKKAEEAPVKQQRDKAQEEFKKELERLAEERRRLELDAKEKLEKERAHLLELERQLDKQRREEADVKRQLEDEHRQRLEAQRQALDARKGGEAAEQTARLKAAEGQRQAEEETRRKLLADEKKQRETLSSCFRRPAPAGDRYAASPEQEQARRREAERMTKEAPARKPLRRTERETKGDRPPLRRRFLVRQ